MVAEDIILRPVITEKSNDALQEGKYTFEVNKKATKVEIAKAVEKLFEVKVLKVNTMNVNVKEKKKDKEDMLEKYLIGKKQL